MTVPTVLFTIALANLIYDLTGFIIKCFDRTKREKDIEKMDTWNGSYYVQALREMEDYATYITRKHDDQIVYKVDGDFNGDIKGDNVTVILMGDGNFNGNIESQDGNVVLIKGNINGDVKANKIVCPTEPTTEDKDQYICNSCYHYVQTPTGSYCTESSALGAALPVGCKACKSYDGTGETTKYKSDCARFSNRSGICHVFHVNTCAIEHNCPYKIKRDECKTEDSTTKHNPAKDVESPKLPVKTLWSCGIPQSTSPQKRTDHYTSIGNHVSIYDSFPVTHIKCPHCKKYFATQVKVRTSVVDGDVVETSIEEMRHDY